MVRLNPTLQHVLAKVNVFPHFTRIFTANRLFYLERSTLWALLVVFLSLNAYAITIIPGRRSALLLTMLTHPLSTDARLAFASSLHEQGLEQQAERELTIAQQYLVRTQGEGTSRVLGAENSPGDLLTQWQKEPEKLKLQRRFWRQISENRPDYRDAYINLGVLVYQEGNVQQARAFFSQALLQDPNSAVASALVAWIQKKE